MKRHIHRLPVAAVAALLTIAARARLRDGDGGDAHFYERDDSTCRHVTAPNGDVDTGRGHIARNETDEDISVIVAPPGGPFRGELGAPSPHCGF